MVAGKLFSLIQQIFEKLPVNGCLFLLPCSTTLRSMKFTLQRAG